MTLEQIQNKYKDYAPVPIINIANELDLKIYETKSLADNQSGVIKKENDNFVIYVNQKHSPERKRFTIAHEIVHFLKHRDKIGDEHVTSSRQPLMRSDYESNDLAERQMETEANKIAADILMPREKFIKIWQALENLEEVAQKFKVSISAATIRANYLLGETII